MTACAVVTTCAVDGCPNESKRAGLCWSHDWRKRRGLSLTAPLQEQIDGDGPKARFARLEAAALRFADATEAPAGGDARKAYLKAKHAYRQAIYRYFVDKYGEVYLVRRDNGEPAPMVKKRA